MKKMLDLFSGLGGASEAMTRSPNWEVLRIENNELLNQVPHTEIVCVKKFLKELKSLIADGFILDESLELIWCSPPCTEFSLAYSSPQSIATREGRDYQPDLSLLHASIEIIRILKPKYWVIENVRGSIKWFKPFLGEPTKVINGSLFLWGKFPAFEVGNIESKYQGEGSSRCPLRANRRALIPFSVSNELMRAIDTQRSILEWVK